MGVVRCEVKKKKNKPVCTYESHTRGLLAGRDLLAMSKAGWGSTQAATRKELRAFSPERSSVGPVDIGLLSPQNWARKGSGQLRWPQAWTQQGGTVNAESCSRPLDLPGQCSSHCPPVTFSTTLEM